MTLGEAKLTDVQVVFFGESKAGKTAFYLSLERALQGRGLTTRSDTLLASNHPPTDGVQIRNMKLGKSKKSEVR